MQTKKEDYYGIEMDFEDVILKGGMIDDVFYLKDLNQRKLFLTQDIEQLSVGEIIKHILQFNKEDKGIAVEKREPILLYVSSRGGEVDSGFGLIDVIQSSQTPVYTINIGYQYSMGFLIGLAGHKRYAFPNSKYLMHDGSNYIFNSGAKAQDQMEFQRKIESRIRKYVLNNSKVTEDEYDGKLRVEWYLFADEAKENGFVDYIIGVDCDINEVI